MSVEITKPIEVKVEPGDIVLSASSGRVLVNVEGKVYLLAIIRPVIEE